MAQTSTTLSGEKSHQNDLSATDISFEVTGTEYKIKTSSTDLGRFSVRDLITVTGSTSNNSTFTVKTVNSSTELVVEEIVAGESAGASITLDHTGFVTDKVKGDGYYSQPDGVHTVSYHVSATLNDDADISLKMQGALATTPTEDDWADISGTTIDQTKIDGSTLAFYANFTGNFVWVRAKVSGMSSGSISKILYNH